MSRYWCELAWLGGERVEAGVVLSVRGQQIEAIETGCEAPPPDATRLAGVTLPGFANAHSHAFQRALRGRTHGGRGSFWSWREQMYGLVARMNPERLEHLARASFAEMALSGVTLVGEFHYLHHRPDGTPYHEPNAMGEALLAAARSVGVRITLLDTCYLHGGLGDSGYTKVAGHQQSFADADAEAWRRRVSALSSQAAFTAGPSARLGAAIHSVRAVDPASMRAVAAWAVQNRAPLHAHVSEQPAENEGCQSVHGCSPVQLLEAQGAMNARFTAVHATHLTASDIALLGRRQATCCFCPTTERDLADGVGPSAELAAAGASLALGSDSQAVIDLFEEARAVELNQRLWLQRRGQHTPAELMYAASAAGYRSLGWPEGGELRVQGLADFTTVDLGSVRLAGTTRESALASVAFAASAGDVSHVVVGGEVVVRDFCHVGLDVAAELRQSVRELTAQTD